MDYLYNKEVRQLNYTTVYMDYGQATYIYTNPNSSNTQSLQPSCI